MTNSLMRIISEVFAADGLSVSASFPPKDIPTLAPPPPTQDPHIFLSSNPFITYILLKKTVRKKKISQRTYPLTFLKIASCRSLSFAESSSRLVLREGIHF